MRKTLMISKTDDGFCISGEGLCDTKVESKTLLLKGDDLFNNIYKKIDKAVVDGIDVQINEASMASSKDDHIAGDIKNILDEINLKLFGDQKKEATLSEKLPPNEGEGLL